MNPAEPRTRPFVDGSVSLLALAAFSALIVFGFAGEMGPWAGALTAALVVLGFLPWLSAGTRVVLLFAAAAGATVVLLPPVWPVLQLALLVVPLAGLLAIPSMKLSSPWFERGRFDALPVVALAVMAGVALVVWKAWAQPDLSDAESMLPQWPVPLLVLGALGFSIVNALLEEVAFRGVLQAALRERFGDGVWPLLLQGAAFGVFHWYGVPRGAMGALMAGSWGVMLGWARRRSGGLLTPLIAHVVADIVIFSLLAMG